MTTISIVLPTYNGARYVRDSIESCLNQTHPDLELIVVDDGSTDDTPRLLATYTDPRMRIIRHDRNRNLPASLNTGFAATRGNFLTWTSDDNRYAPNALEVMLSALNSQPDVGLVYAGCRLVDDEGRLIRVAPAEPPDLLKFKSVVFACFLYRRSVYETVGNYNEHLFRIEDYEYWLRVNQVFQLKDLPDILYDYRIHHASLTSQESLVDRARAFDFVHTRMFGPDPQRLRRYLGELYMARAFEEYYAGAYSRVSGNVIQALANNAGFVMNRGVWSIFLRSLLSRMTGMPGLGAVKSRC